MGDLVRSEAAPSVRRLHKAFNIVIDNSNRRFQKELSSPLTITLGDEFQGLIISLETGLALMRHVRFDLKVRQAACRFVLGTARLDSPVNRSRAWNMMGYGLAAAREKLSDKKLTNAYRFSLPRDRALERTLDAVGASIAEVENRWTARQFEVVYATMNRAATADEIADELGVVKRVYYKIRKAAQLDFYTDQWSTLKETMRDLDKRYGLPE